MYNLGNRSFCPRCLSVSAEKHCSKALCNWNVCTECANVLTGTVVYNGKEHMGIRNHFLRTKRHGKL